MQGVTSEKQAANEKKKEDTSMTSFTKTEYWRNLVPNTESVEDTTNSYFKYNPDPTISEYEAQFVPSKHIFKNSPISLHSQQHTKI